MKIHYENALLGTGGNSDNASENVPMNTCQHASGSNNANIAIFGQPTQNPSGISPLNSAQASDGNPGNIFAKVLKDYRGMLNILFNIVRHIFIFQFDVENSL